MDLNSFIESNAILNIEKLSDYENKPLWIVLLSSFNSQDYYSVKIPWIHDGIFDHSGKKFNSDYDPAKIYLCRNKENPSEYIAVHDFIQLPDKTSNFNVIFTDETIADALVNTLIITRSNNHTKLQGNLDKIVEQRSFALREKNNYSIFNMISATNEILINLIPK